MSKEVRVFEIGDRVRIVKEPFFYAPFSEPPDLTHLIGLECEVTGFVPNIFELKGDGYDSAVERSKNKGVGFYFIDIPPTDKGVPRGLLTEGFGYEYLEKIENE